MFRFGGFLDFAPSAVPAGIRRFDVGTGVAYEVGSSISPGEVRAVTFDAIAREIVLIDEPSSVAVPAPQLRLLRINPFDGAARVVKTWTKDGPCTQFWLSVDGSGRLVLAANRPAAFGYAMYAFSGEGAGFVSRRMRWNSGMLVTPPWSNHSRFYLPIQATSGSAAVSIGSLAVVSTGDVVDVAECF